MQDVLLGLVGSLWDEGQALVLKVTGSIPATGVIFFFLLEIISKELMLLSRLQLLREIFKV